MADPPDGVDAGGGGQFPPPPPSGGDGHPRRLVVGYHLAILPLNL